MQPVLKMREQNSQYQKSIAMKSLFFNRSLVTAFILLLLAFLFSCQKENSSVPAGSGVTEQDAATYSEESAQADENFDDIADVSMTAADADNTATNGRLNRDYHPDFA